MWKNTCLANKQKDSETDPEPDPDPDPDPDPVPGPEPQVLSSGFNFLEYQLFVCLFVFLQNRN